MHNHDRGLLTVVYCHVKVCLENQKMYRNYVLVLYLSLICMENTIGKNEIQPVEKLFYILHYRY